MKKICSAFMVVALLSACDEGTNTAGSGSASSKTPGTSSAKKTASASATSKTTTSAPPAPVASASAAASTSASASASADAAAPGADIKIAPMKMTLGDKKESVTIELAADGTLKPSKPGKDTKTLKFVKNELQDETGKWVLRVLADGSVEARTTHTVMKDGKVESESEDIKKIGTLKGDTIEGEKGSITIGDDGKVTLKDKDGKAPPADFKITLDGMKPEAKQAALLLVVSVLMLSKQTSDMSHSSVSAPASAAPAAGSAAVPPKK